MFGGQVKELKYHCNSVYALIINRQIFSAFKHEGVINSKHYMGQQDAAKNQRWFPHHSSHTYVLAVGREQFVVKWNRGSLIWEKGFVCLICLYVD